MADMSVHGSKTGIYYALAVVIFFVGIALSFAAFTAARKWEDQKTATEFNRVADNRYFALQKEIEMDVQVFSSFLAFHLHPDRMSRMDFYDVAGTLLSEHEGFQSLEWLPRVSYAGRGEYERKVRREGFPRFHITERAASGKIITAGNREEYFPCYFIEPYETNKAAMGFDVASDPDCRKAMEQSRETGEVSATGRITLVQRPAGDYSLMLFAPVYETGGPAGPAKGRKDLKGFVAGVFLIKEIVEGALSNLESEALDLYIYDQSAPGENNLLFFQPSSLRRDAVSPMRYKEIISLRLQYVNTLNVAGHRHDWLLVNVPAAEFIVARETEVPKAVFSAGLLLTGLLAGYLWVGIRRAEELSNTNSHLLLEIAERKKAEGMLAERERRLIQSYETTRTILDSMPVIVSIIDVTDFTLVDVNNEFMKEYGIKEKSEVIGRTCHEVTHHRPDVCAPPNDICPLTEAVKNKIYTEVEHIHYDANDKKKCMMVSASPICNEKGDVIQVVHICRDFSERKRYEEELQRISVTDELTGLFNRRGFYTLAEQQLKLANRKNRGIYLLYADLNGFKAINDSFGHGEGDAALKEAASVIKECFRDSDVVARVGGDEFAVIPIGIAGDNVDTILERFRKKTESYNKAAGRNYTLSFSIGTAYYDPSNPCPLDELLTQADRSMYRDKKKS